ncbi:WD40 repeat-like protein [Annulohypoxylon maeteangense]|uniref:WD40 repeat-like protein n=1 Tax=Annulohypoxylon maeteangense TaxID=1927788 RepID=UPI002008E850|nr:WD40 repeat-like protein [Annulohypoxylon maeteangense]KAI0886449.1 WD40 repeat-like protein [Annulohypoxylon maeteangense]
MDDFDRDSNASSDNEHEDDLMIHDAEADGDVDVDGEDENENADHDEDDNENENEEEEEDDADQHEHEDEEDTQDLRQPNGLSNPAVTRMSATPGPLATPKWTPRVRPEVLTAPTYDIVPTMAAPMATSINAIAITPDLRYWMTGGSDGYIRKYDGPATINGKTLLTVAQRHPFVDSVTKAGVLMSYWENAESAPVRQEDQVLSPVYSLAVHSQALWLLSGLESGGINLQSVRHDEGKRITCLKKHTNAVSVLTLSPDEKSVLSGSWDKNIFDWDLNTGQVKRQFDGSGGQISAIEIRPMGGVPIPPEASEEDIASDTLFTNNSHPGADGDLQLELDGGFGTGLNNSMNGTGINGVAGQTSHGRDGAIDAQGSPAHDSLFGGSPTGGSDLFGDNDGMGAFGGDDDNEFSRAMMQDSAQDASVAMGDFDMSGPTFEPDTGQVPAAQPLPDTNQPDPTLFGDNALNSFGTDASHDPSSLPTLPDFPLPSAGDHPFPSHPAGVLQSAIPGPQGLAPQSPSTVFAAPAPIHYDMAQTSDSTFLSASIHGTLRVWDRRMPNPVARIDNKPGIPPWCMGACWSPDGNWIYAGRRNGTVEEFSVQRARGGRVGWQAERVFKFPGGSGPVSCVRSMANGRHLVCASHDILRLYDLRSGHSSKHSPPPFLIIPGPPRAGVISSLYIDPSSRFMLSAAGNRGWEGTTTEVLIGYEINVPA